MRKIGSCLLFTSLVLTLSACGVHKLHQTYYLGVFDPQEQVPTSLYRVRVLGSADFISTVNFAAGWVPAEFIDSLGSRVQIDREDGSVKLSGTDDAISKFALTTGRRLMLFGPEGFREAPRNHRLVVLMDSDPSKFFESIDEALGQLSTAKQLTLSGEAQQRAALSADLLQITREQRDLAKASRLEVVDPGATSEEGK